MSITCACDIRSAVRLVHNIELLVRGHDIVCVRVFIYFFSFPIIFETVYARRLINKKTTVLLGSRARVSRSRVISRFFFYEICSCFFLRRNTRFDFVDKILLVENDISYRFGPIRSVVYKTGV